MNYKTYGYQLQKNKFLLLVFLLLSSCAGNKKISHSEYKKVFAPICTNVDGKGRFKSGRQEILFDLETVDNGKVLKMAMSFPFHGQKVLELDYRNAGKVSLKGSALGNLKREFKNSRSYNEAKNLLSEVGRILRMRKQVAQNKRVCGADSVCKIEGKRYHFNYHSDGLELSRDIDRDKSFYFIASNISEKSYQVLSGHVRKNTGVQADLMELKLFAKECRN